MDAWIALAQVLGAAVLGALLLIGGVYAFWLFGAILVNLATMGG